VEFIQLVQRYLEAEEGVGYGEYTRQ